MADTVRCRYNVNFLSNPLNILDRLPMKVRYGVLFVSLKSDLSSATVFAVLYVILWYFGPHNNGTQLYQVCHGQGKVREVLVFLKVMEKSGNFATCCQTQGQVWEFLAATKQLYKWYFPSVRLSVRPSVCLSHLFHHVPIIVSSWKFQELLPWSRVMSMQKVKVRGQRSRSQRSTPNLAVSGL